MNARNPALTATLLAVVATATLAACGQSTSTTSTPASNTGSSAGSPQAGTSGTSSSTDPTSPAVKTIDICAQISAAKAAQLSGQPYTTATAPTDGEWTAQCAYNNDDATALGVTLSMSNQNVDTTWEAAHTGSFTDISGLGDKAFWDNNNTLYAVSGQMIIQVNGLDSQDKSEALARALLAALG